MKVRIYVNDGHMLDGKFFEKGKYTVSIEVEKNEKNESCIKELVEGNFPWLLSLGEQNTHWFIIVRKEDIMKISAIE